MRTAVYLMICVILVLPACEADDKIEAMERVKCVVHRVLPILHDGDLDRDEKIAKVMEVVEPFIDFELMAKLALGQRHWGAFSEKQREEFTRLFVEQLKNTYFEKAELLTDEAVTIEDTVMQRGRAHVKTRVLSKGEPLDMLYKLFKTNDEWKAYDVEVQGVSLVTSYRSQYNQALSSGSPEDLLSRMRERGDGEAQPAPGSRAQ